MNEFEFKQHIESLGYGEAQVREFDANKSGELHTHDFSAILMVIDGEFSLAFEESTIQCALGEPHEVTAGMRHDERAGPTGARILLATK